METLKKDELIVNYNLLNNLKKIYSNRKNIIIFVMFFFVLGILFAIISPNEFTSSTIFVPQSANSNKQLGNLGSVASVAGINIGDISNTTEVSPILYPKIVYSADFLKKILEIRVSIDGIVEEITYRDFYENHYQTNFLTILKKYTIFLPFTILKALKAPDLETSLQLKEKGDNYDFLYITQLEVQHLERLANQIVVKANDKEGFVIISFSMPEPLAAAQMAKAVQNLLQKSIIDLRTKGLKEQLDYTISRFNQQEEKLEEIDNKLSSFRDKNQNISSSYLQNELRRLESEYSLQFNLYNDLARQVELARIQVNKETPIFSIIEDVNIPAKRSKPNKPLIVLIFIFFGIIFSILFISYKDLSVKIKNAW